MKHMRKLAFGLFGLGLALMPITAAHAQDFLTGHEDLPLLAGLEQDPDTTLIFDTPRGRVIETYAHTDSKAEAVFKAYGDALPQMGWIAKGKHRFVRNGETLTFEVISHTTPVVIRILLTAD